MKRTKAIALLFCTMPMTAFANQYNNIYGSYEQNYPTSNYNPGYKIQDVRFFIGLNTTLLRYDQVKVSYDDAHVSEKETTTEINYKVFDNSSFTFGIDSDNGFRLSLGFVHYNHDMKIMGVSDNEASEFVLGAALDIPFVKKEITSPFLRFGVEYISIDQNNIDIKTPAVSAGLGLTHNFSQDIFGVLATTYTFMIKADISELNASYKENQFAINMGIGYRF